MNSNHIWILPSDPESSFSFLCCVTFTSIKGLPLLFPMDHTSLSLYYLVLFPIQWSSPSLSSISLLNNQLVLWKLHTHLSIGPYLRFHAESFLCVRTSLFSPVHRLLPSLSSESVSFVRAILTCPLAPTFAFCRVLSDSVRTSCAGSCRLESSDRPLHLRIGPYLPFGRFSPIPHPTTVSTSHRSIPSFQDDFRQPLNDTITYLPCWMSPRLPLWFFFWKHLRCLDGNSSDTASSETPVCSLLLVNGWFPATPFWLTNVISDAPLSYTKKGS